jgi:hypothetical protein
VSRVSELLVPRRYCGPPDSGNGGWTAGALATLVSGETPGDGSRRWPVTEVSLRQPPPLDSAMAVSQDESDSVAAFGGAVIATARPVDATLTDVEPVDAAEARAAEDSYPGLDFHPFPTCFVCGTAREVGDGLRIFPGQVGIDRAAATWTPHPSVARAVETSEAPRATPAVTWAALDCTGAWSADFGERLMVLGRMTARLDTLPVIGEEHVVVGEARGQEGRKSFTATTLYDADGRVVATAEHIWIAVDPARFGGEAPL